MSAERCERTQCQRGQLGLEGILGSTTCSMPIAVGASQLTAIGTLTGVPGGQPPAGLPHVLRRKDTRMTTPIDRQLTMVRAPQMATVWVAATLLFSLLLAGCGNGTDETAADAPRESAQAETSEEETAPDQTLEQGEAAQQEAEEEEVSPPASSGPVALLDGVEYRVGDCFVYAREDVEESASPGQLVPCDEPHDGEVFAIDDELEGPPVWPEVELQLSEYLGVEPSELDDWLSGEGLSIGVLVSFTGGQSGVALMYLTPTDEADIQGE